jgi:hypothetical protein
VRPGGFDLAFAGRGEPADVIVVDVAPAERHLLLLDRTAGEKRKFLCGRDERHWFVAAIPDGVRGVRGVPEAKAALLPPAVARLQGKRAYVRQGEWFFVPAPRLDADPLFVRRGEPLARPGGTPHVLELAYRRGGRLIYVHTRTGQMIGEENYSRLPAQKRGYWRQMVRDPELFARGAVRHPDHATIVLRDWHRVLMSRERPSLYVAFLD